MVLNLYQQDNNEIVIISRTKNGERTKQLITDFRPYFYVLDDEGLFKSLFNQPLRKIVLNSPSEVPKERQKYNNSFESDILYLNRYLIDKYDTLLNVPVRKLYFDIETDETEDINLAIKSGNSPIYCITIKDSFSGVMKTLIWHPRFNSTENKPQLNDILWYKTEQEMLTQFIVAIVAIDPDVILGWNSNSFDAQFIINRCRKLNVDINKISMNRILKINNALKIRGDRETEIECSGRYFFDLARAYRQLISPNDWSLDAVSKEYLNKQKIEVRNNITELWQNNPEKLIEYNRMDVLLAEEIDKHLSLFDAYNNARIELGCQWISLWNTNGYTDISFLREARRLGIVLPSKFHGEPEEMIKGAFVHETIPGLHHGVIVLDLQSLYPSIMRSMNMSLETLDPNGEIDCKNGIKFKKQPKGIVSHCLEKFLNIRKGYKQKMKEALMVNDKVLYNSYNKRQYWLKVLANSIYGWIKNEYSRLHRREIAASVTQIGQDINKWSAKIAQEAGYKVCYGDTDSLFIELGEVTIDEMIIHGKNIEVMINASYDEFAKQYRVSEHYFKIQFEKTYRDLYFGSASDGVGTKKRYTGWQVTKGEFKMEEAEFIAVGFEIRRNDSAPIAKQIQTTIFKLILSKGDKKAIMDYVNEMKAKLKNMEYKYSDFALPKNLKKDIYKTDNPWIRGKRYSEKAGIKFTPRSKVRLLYVKQMPKPYLQTDAFCFEYDDQVPEGITIDWDRQFAPLIDNKVEKVLEALGMDSNVDNSKSIKEWF